MSPDRQFDELIRRHKFALVSENKHRKFQDPEGRILVVAKTPSDYWAWQNAVSTLKRVVATPVPSSALIEEERQRRELEQYIQIAAEKQKKAGITGKSKSSVAGGSGIKSIIVQNAETVAQREARVARGLERAAEKREAKQQKERERREFARLTQNETADFLDFVDRSADASAAREMSCALFAKQNLDSLYKHIRSQADPKDDTAVGDYLVNVVRDIKVEGAAVSIKADEESVYADVEPLHDCSDDTRDALSFKARSIVDAYRDVAEITCGVWTTEPQMTDEWAKQCIRMWIKDNLAHSLKHNAALRELFHLHALSICTCPDADLPAELERITKDLPLTFNKKNMLEMILMFRAPDVEAKHEIKERAEAASHGGWQE